jgi:hypothetical protein
MKHKLILCLALVLSGGLYGCSDEKTDKRIESVTLPSGEVLENHTYLKSDLGSDRYNELYLKNPVTGASERIDDRLGYLNYEAGPNDPALLKRYPHPQEFTYRNKKVLVIGPYLCKRINSPKAPYWEITPINADNDAQVYLKSFLPTNISPSEIGKEGRLRFDVDSLDLTNNILTIKKQMPNERENWDEFPPYLVYSELGLNDDSIYTFPSKFDIARTKAKNGPLWNKP